MPERQYHTLSKRVLDSLSVDGNVLSRTLSRSSVCAGLLAVVPLLLAMPAVVPQSLAQEGDNTPPYVTLTTGWTEINPGGSVVLTATAGSLDVDPPGETKRNRERPGRPRTSRAI